MIEENGNTEQKILDSAVEIFTEKGLTGARMQEIADHAGINKALLHYYFRSKDKLFKAAFKMVFSKFIPKALTIFADSDLPLFTKIKGFMAAYIEGLMENPSIPIFILTELSRNGEGITETVMENLSSFKIKPLDMLQKDLDKALKAEEIVPTKAEELFVNILSLCIFPIAGRPVIEKIAFNNQSKTYDAFLEKRVAESAEFVIRAIKK